MDRIIVHRHTPSSLFSHLIPLSLNESIDSITGRRAFWEACGDAAGGEGLGSFPSKLEAMAEYHVGEVVTSLVKARLGTRGDREVSWGGGDGRMEGMKMMER